MHVYKGGRGVKAPYKSKVVRVPEPILGEVERLIECFYSQIPNSVENNRLIQADEAVFRAREILTKNQTSKRSTKVCLEKLLQSLYGDKSINL